MRPIARSCRDEVDGDRTQAFDDSQSDLTARLPFPPGEKSEGRAAERQRREPIRGIGTAIERRCFGTV